MRYVAVISFILSFRLELISVLEISSSKMASIKSLSTKYKKACLSGTDEVTEQPETSEAGDPGEEDAEEDEDEENEKAVASKT